MILDIINFFINFIVMFSLFYNASIAVQFLYNKGHLGHIYIYLNNNFYNFCNNDFYNFCNNDFYINCKNFITKFEKKMSKKLLIYNGIYDSDFSDSDSDSSTILDSFFSTSLDSSSTSTSLDSALKPEIKYEDKYLDDVKKMSAEYVFSLAENTLISDKFNEFFNIHKINLVNEKHNLNIQILEKSVKYISIDDTNDSDTNDSDSTNDSDTNDLKEDSEEKETKDLKEDDILNEYYDIKKNEIRKEKRKKVIELEIGDLHAKLKEVEKMSDDFLIITNAKLDARNFVIKERLDGLKNNFILEKTPVGNVIMYYDNSRESFEYYSDNTIPYRFLETISRKYVKTFNCKQIYFDMEFELNEFERKQKETQKMIEDQKEDQKKILDGKGNTELVKKKDVFAKFKGYNTESGTGKVNRGVAPPKNSIPNNTMKKKDDKFILKDNANRYTCAGKLANFSFLKKTARKTVDKKYAMSFADFKKMKK